MYLSLQSSTLIIYNPYKESKSELAGAFLVGYLCHEAFNIVLTENH